MKNHILWPPERAKKKQLACCHMKAMKPTQVFARYEKQGQRCRIFHGDTGYTGDTRGHRGHKGIQGTQETHGTQGTRDREDTRDKGHTGVLRTFSTFRDCYIKSFWLASFWVVLLLASRGFWVHPWKYLLLFCETFLSLLVLEDRIKRGEISGTIWCVLVFSTPK